MLAGLLLGTSAGQALGREPPGLVVRREALALLDGMSRIDDGDPSAPRVRVIFSPGCPHSLRMWEASRELRMRASWRWIPYGGTDAGRRSCAAALADGGVAALEACMRGTLAAAAGPGAMDAQDNAIDMRAGRMLWEATGRAIGTPTTVYERGSGVAYAVRGSMPADRLLEMVEVAA